MVSQHQSRIAIYCQDGLGLGHLRRNIEISKCFLEHAPKSNVLLFTDSPVAPFFRLPDFVDHLKLPSVRKIRAGVWQPTRLSIQTSEMRRLRSGLLLKGLVGFRPDLLLVDHMPAGAQGELIPALNALKLARPNSSIVLGLRDILDAPNVTMDTWQRDGAYDALRLYYDRVLIYGSCDLFDTVRKYRITETTKGIHYCGYVASRDHLESASQIREHLASRKTKSVLVAAGGGADGHYLMRAYLRTIRLLASSADFTTLMAVGVNAPQEVFRELSAD